MSNPHPEMRMESLARYAFQCGRGGDPWGYANADFWANELVGNHVSSAARTAMITVMTGAILRNRENEDIASRLMEIHAECLAADTVHSLIRLFDHAGAICGLIPPLDEEEENLTP